MLRVCLDARLISGAAGGVESVVIGLASGLSKLTDGDEEYLFLVWADQNDWIRPYIKGPCRLLHSARAPRVSRWRQALRNHAHMRSMMRHARDAWMKIQHFTGRHPIRVPESDGTIERAGVDVMHFTTQNGFLTDIPSIYHPHDLQHLHLPQFFDYYSRLRRETIYRALCNQAKMVSVVANWGKMDLMKHYRLPEEKIRVINLAPVLDAYQTPSESQKKEVCDKFRLSEAFIFYPAQTWPHKNHCKLLEAIACLRNRGLTVPLVCSGQRNEFFPVIQRHVSRLGLDQQVSFLGFVDTIELQCLYSLCRAVVIPTRFEAASGPMYDAFMAGAAVACSNVTSLPEQAGDAALIFDPDDVEGMANAIQRLWNDVPLRKILHERGRKQVAKLTWDRSARIFRAHYRCLAGAALTDEDQQLLQTA